ncbi:Ger(x)C family spore germination protein [Sediminibacillus albus]|uniref:Germination protein, Ger(X)C family n=1 Tax=Sediminibacillus albus TaxID=407036 RepID=A0A1G9CAG3_9BACI|nr:Ger(x)C family spore germination protein [Sediminibacillus albus]SDK48375.1 germination protein, Ger(x)C family [Sediminibacillus albus]
MARLRWAPLLLCLLLLTGCWDQRQFKNVKLVLAAGIDSTEEGKVTNTVVITNVQNGQSGNGTEQMQVVTASANTPLESRTKIDQKISKRYDQSKLHVLLLGEKLVEKDIYPYLDMFYRDPKSNLHARLAVVGGKVEEALSLNIAGEPRISEYINGMLTGEIRSTQMPNNNIQLVCAELLEPGQDFVLPYLTTNEEESLLQYDGLALFSGKSYSGSYLSQENAKLFLLLKNVMGADAMLTRKIADDKEAVNNYITVDVKEINRKLAIDTNKQIPKVTLDVHLEVDVLEYPPDHLQSEKKVKELEEKLEKTLTKEAGEIIAQLKEANSDALGIGRRIQGYHPGVWKQLNWEEVYPELTIDPKISVDIQSHGIIN